MKVLHSAFHVVTAFVLLFFAGNALAQGRKPLISVLGDSYVRNHRRPWQESWHALAAEELGCEYSNHGRNGGCVAFDRSSEGFGPSLLVRYQELEPNSDIVLIIAGHNDADKIKNSADSLAMFADSLDLLLDRIAERCPQARIAWVTPWWVGRDGFAPVCKTIRAICKRHHVPVLDNCNKKSIIKVRDDDFRHRYFQGDNDTAHLNADGHKLFLPVGKKFIQKLQKR